MDGAVYIFKARLVAKGFTQTYGVDYEETFSPVADIRAIRILIAIAAYYDYEIWQMDVKTAFLNGHLSEEVYMEQPEGFVNPKYPNHVCKLKRSIYGLKQASRQWNKRFDDEIKKFGFAQNPDEPCVYLKASGSYVAILILYVDDILLMGNNIPMLQDVKSYLGRSFAMKDLGDAAYILGIKIYRDRSKRLIGLNQSAYIEKILKRFYMENSKRGTIPMQEKLKLSKSQGASTPAEKQRMQNIPYASAIGSIMYAVRCTRPDVAFAQNMTSRFQQNPGEEHWTAVKNILKYLRNTKDMFLIMCSSQNGGDCDWKSTKQSIFATSSTDAEYIAAFDASKEAVWIRKFISGLGIVPTIEEPISMYCDNTGAIAIAKDDGVTKGARHFRAKVHYLRETIKMGDMTTSVGNNSVFRSFFEKQKLTGPNFIDWYRQLRLDLAAHAAWVKGQREVVVLMLLTMDLDIQRNLAPFLAAYGMASGTISLCFSKQLKGNYLQTVREFHTCMQEEGHRLAPFLKIEGPTLTIWERLGQPVGQNLAVSLILVSLNKDFTSFVQNFNMHGMGKTVNELHAMLKLHEESLPKKTSPPPMKDNPARTPSVYQMCVKLGMEEGNTVRGSHRVDEKRSYSGRLAFSIFTKTLSFPSNLGYMTMVVENVSCLSGKMARKPYSHQVERAKDLLGLIHTDVCGPFRIVSRQGASYFVTFTDDFSRYGYVYLLKHKHEVFETFKVFQKEVENQLGKTIKSLRSDRGGEYMSQEFLDHLKEHGIIAHRTPPYTPQNNGVSERRNRTLLDMVRSMMSQTTLPKSFWIMPLRLPARILNMVPLRRLIRPPYELFGIGQAPKLSYLRVWFFESKLLDLKASGSVEDLEEIQEEDTNPSVDTSLNHEEDDQEIDEPQSDINPIRRSTRTRRPTDRLCLYIDTEEHELGDLGEPANYRAAYGSWNPRNGLMR
ncbi:retrotransposon protein, putative, ty1-copia subclass [Tanacetum coccineum]